MLKWQREEKELKGMFLEILLPVKISFAPARSLLGGINGSVSEKEAELHF